MDANIEVSEIKEDGGFNSFPDFQFHSINKKKNSFIFKRQLKDSNQLLTIEIESLTEQIITTTAFLLLNELGTYPPEKRQVKFGNIIDHFSYPVYRLPSSDIISNSRQFERLRRGESIVEWDKRFGRGLAINVYTPWGSTSDVLALGTIPFFDPYPPRILASFLVMTLISVALSVMFIIKHLCSRIHLLQDQVDAIRPLQGAEGKETKNNDVIDQLNLKISDMALRINSLLNEKDEMLRGISHDLRTPISKILFRLETIAEHIGKNHPMLEGCRSDLNQLNHLIDELLTYEKIVTQKVIQFENVHIVKLIRNIVDSINAIHPKLDIKLNVDPQASHYLCCNESLMTRLLENLLNNALKFAKQKIIVGVMSNDVQFEITIDDDGKGLDESTIQKLFNPFFQADLSRTGPRKGYGLGLAIVSQIAKEHSAEVKAGNNRFGGAHFSVSFPLKSGTNKKNLGTQTNG
jgi:two-component system sensor histidine kinase RstB